MKKKLIASLAAAVFAASASLSLADSYKLDSVHSMVIFQIHHLVSNPFGVFHAADGTVTTDGDAISALEISLPVDKLDMGNDKWADDIKAASWFDVKQFPTITFKTSSIKKTGDDTYDATGDLTLHGVTKTITVSITKTGEGKGMQGETRVGVSATFKVKRSDYGMTTYIGPIGDEVTLSVNVEAIKS
jgi:polyisoprenoid-binding protein YceI